MDAMCSSTPGMEDQGVIEQHTPSHPGEGARRFRGHEWPQLLLLNNYINIKTFRLYYKT
jgi:hypothetical protein